MALLNNAFGTKREVEPNSYVENDFTDGMTFVEYVNGLPDSENAVVLFGTFMPKDKFPTGKMQKMSKEYYVGSKYPTVHVLGSQEKDIDISGSFKEYHLKDTSLEGAAVAYKQKFDELVERGNVIKISLGSYFSKYCILEEADFELIHLKSINYKIKISVIGDKLPANYYLTDSNNVDSTQANNDLIKKVLEHQKLLETKPTTIPVTVTDTINNVINEVSEKIKFVTDFVDGVLTDSEAILDASYKAVALIQNAKSFIAKSNRRIGLITNQATNLVSTNVSPADKKLFEINNLAYLVQIRASNRALTKQLNTIQKNYASYLNTVPLRRYQITQSDSLQRISIKFYGTAEYWNKIMSHNKLASTNLVTGSIIEIPKI